MASSDAAACRIVNAHQARDIIDRLDRRAERHTPLSDGGHRVVWRRFGDGPPLVLLHGGHGSWLHWVRNIDALSSQRSLWIPDMPGFGESDAIGSDLFRLVDALDKTLGTLIGRDTPFDLGGFSFGGLVGANLAARNPRVRRLVLVGPGGHGGPRRPRAELMAWRHAENDAARLAALRHNLAAHMLAPGATIDPLALEVHVRSCLSTRFHSRSISRSSLLLSTLAEFSRPLCVIFGEHDVTATPDIVSATLVGGGAQREAHTVAGAGHWVQYERAEAVNRLITAWLSTPS